MRGTQPKGEIALALGALVALEEEFTTNARALDRDLTPRLYEWRPSGVPELPAVWNWIEPSPTERVDDAKLADLLVVRATVGVKPSDLGETANRLVRLIDVFRATVDPALDANPPLGGTVKEAKRTITSMEIDDFNGTPVLCMSMLLQLRLVAAIR